MSRTRKEAKRGRSRDRHISVRGVQRIPADLSKLSRATVRIAIEQAAAEQAAQNIISKAEPAGSEEPDHE